MLFNEFKNTADKIVSSITAYTLPMLQVLLVVHITPNQGVALTTCACHVTPSMTSITQELAPLVGLSMVLNMKWVLVPTFLSLPTMHTGFRTTMHPVLCVLLEAPLWWFLPETSATQGGKWSTRDTWWQHTMDMQAELNLFAWTMTLKQIQQVIKMTMVCCSTKLKVVVALSLVLLMRIIGSWLVLFAHWQITKF